MKRWIKMISIISLLLFALGLLMTSPSWAQSTPLLIFFDRNVNFDQKFQQTLTDLLREAGKGFKFVLLARGEEKTKQAMEYYEVREEDFPVVLVLTTDENRVEKRMLQKRSGRGDEAAGEAFRQITGKEPPSPKPKLPRDEWMNLLIMGTKVGYAHVSMEKSEYVGEEVIKIRSEMFIELKRGDQKLQLSKTKISYCGMDLSPRYVIAQSNESGEKWIEATVQGNEIVVKTTFNGQVTEVRKTVPKGIIWEEMLFEITRQRGLKVGAQYTFDVFNMELLQPINTQVEVVREETIEYQGESERVYVLDYTLDVMGGSKSREWVASDGTTYKMEMGSMIEMVKTNRENALGDIGEVDIIANTKIIATGKQPTPNTSYFKARVSLMHGDIQQTFIRNERQRIVAEAGAKSGILEVQTLPIQAESAPNIPITNPNLKKYLASTIYVQADDTSIRRQAWKIVGNETNSWRVAQLICNWVHQNMNLTMGVSFGSAKQTLESLQGDSTEYTVLFTALARAVGIPTRICSGLAYGRNAFVYIFWPEVYVGKWIAMSPSGGQIQADATHIQLAGSTLESDSALEFGEGINRTINNLQIEILITDIKRQ